MSEDGSGSLDNFYLVLWVYEGVTSVVTIKDIVRKKKSRRELLDVTEGDLVTVKWDGRKCLAKVILISVDKTFLESVDVHKETHEIISQTKVPPSPDVVALKRSLSNRSCDIKKKSKTLIVRSLLQNPHKGSIDLEAESDSKDERNNTPGDSCNGQCSTCCNFPFRAVLPKLTPDVLEGLSALFQFVSTVQSVNECYPDEFIGSSQVPLPRWQVSGMNKVEIGRKGSGVWIDADDLHAAKSVSRNAKIFQDRAYFRRLLSLVLGDDAIKKMAAEHAGATTIAQRIWTAIEETVNAEYHSRSPPGRSYYYRVANNMLCHVRKEMGLSETVTEQKNQVLAKRNTAQSNEDDQENMELEGNVKDRSIQKKKNHNEDNNEKSNTDKGSKKEMECRELTEKEKHSKEKKNFKSDGLKLPKRCIVHKNSSLKENSSCSEKRMKKENIESRYSLCKQDSVEITKLQRLTPQPSNTWITPEVSPILSAAVQTCSGHHEELNWFSSPQFNSVSSSYIESNLSSSYDQISPTQKQQKQQSTDLFSPWLDTNSNNTLVPCSSQFCPSPNLSFSPQQAPPHRSLNQHSHDMLPSPNPTSPVNLLTQFISQS